MLEYKKVSFSLDYNHEAYFFITEKKQHGYNLSYKFAKNIFLQKEKRKTVIFMRISQLKTETEEQDVCVDINSWQNNAVKYENAIVLNTSCNAIKKQRIFQDKLYNCKDELLKSSNNYNDLTCHIKLHPPIFQVGLQTFVDKVDKTVTVDNPKWSLENYDNRNKNLMTPDHDINSSIHRKINNLKFENKLPCKVLIKFSNKYTSGSIEKILEKKTTSFIFKIKKPLRIIFKVKGTILIAKKPISYRSLLEKILKITKYVCKLPKKCINLNFVYKKPRQILYKEVLNSKVCIGIVDSLNETSQANYEHLKIVVNMYHCSFFANEIFILKEIFNVVEIYEEKVFLYIIEDKIIVSLETEIVYNYPVVILTKSIFSELDDRYIIKLILKYNVMS